MAFFRKSHDRSYDVLSVYNWFAPDWRGIWTLVLWFVVGAIIGNVVAGIIALVSVDFFNTYGQMIAYPLMFIPPMIYASHKSQSNMMFETGYAIDNNHFSPLGGLLTALLVSVATIACAMVTDPVTELLPPMPDMLKHALESMLHGPLWVTLLCVSVFAPFFEEWLCRGMVLRGLLRKMKPVWAIVISAAFFAIIHLNPWQGIPAFALGCLFGWVYYRTGSLKLTMLMHCVNNTFSTIMSRIPGFEEAETFRQVFANQGMYWIIYACCVILVVLAILSLSRIRPADACGSCEEIPATEQ